MPVEVVTHLLIYHVSEYWRCNLLFHCGEPLLSLVTFTWDLLQSHSLSSPTLECHWKVPWWWVLGVGGGCIRGGGCAPLATKGSSVVVGAPVQLNSCLLTADQPAQTLLPCYRMRNKVNQWERWYHSPFWSGLRVLKLGPFSRLRSYFSKLIYWEQSSIRRGNTEVGVKSKTAGMLQQTGCLVKGGRTFHSNPL